MAQNPNPIYVRLTTTDRRVLDVLDDANIRVLSDKDMQSVVTIEDALKAYRVLGQHPALSCSFDFTLMPYDYVFTSY